MKIAIAFILGFLIAISTIYSFSIEEFTSYDCRLWGENVTLYRQKIYCNHAWYIKVWNKYVDNANDIKRLE